jgi:amidase
VEIVRAPASDLARGLAAGRWSAVEVMQAHLDRIAAVNGAVNAIVSLRDPEQLLAEAKGADEAPSRGWLHGIPFAIKDLVATKGLATSYGSPLFRDFIPDADDLVAARLRAAGAILIGKTNTPEWGHGSHSFNPVHGVTRNPYDLGKSAGGSSGGAAAALASGMVAVADGSDMMGSLRNPAAFCNVYGFRPTWGLVPQDADGDVFMHTMATDGPMARTVEDLARLLAVLAGPNPSVPFGRPSEDFAAALAAPPPRPLRIGWLGNWDGAYPCEPGILETCAKALTVFEAAGAVIEPVVAPFPAGDLWQSWTTLRAMLNANAMRALYDDPASRAQLKPETRWEIEQGQGLTARDVYAASVIRSRWYARAADLFTRYDALAMPATQVWPFPADWRWPERINDRAMDTYHRWMEIVVPVSLIGLPSLCLPAGFSEAGLPTGVQLFGPTGSDAHILATGHAYHQATRWPERCPPRL